LVEITYIWKVGFRYKFKRKEEGKVNGKSSFGASQSSETKSDSKTSRGGREGQKVPQGGESLSEGSSLLFVRGVVDGELHREEKRVKTEVGIGLFRTFLASESEGLCCKFLFGNVGRGVDIIKKMGKELNCSRFLCRKVPSDIGPNLGSGSKCGNLNNNKMR